jgi:outer membrane protein TolC
MRKELLFTCLLGIFCLGSFGQGFSLRQCIEYANRNNGTLRNAQYDLEIAQMKINEQVGTMFPQVDVSGNYKDNLKLSTTVMPAELIGGNSGETVAISMGTQYNITAEANLNQKLLDPTFGIALKAARLSKLQSEQALLQTQEELYYNISVTYYQTLVIQRKTEALKATLDASTESLISTDLKYKNGLAKKIDVDKIRVSCNNTGSSLHQSELNYQQSLNKLKYYMGMPVDSNIVLSDTMLSFMLVPEVVNTDDFKVENHIDYKLQQTSLSLYEANKKKEIAGYLPTLSFNAWYDYNAMRSEFNFFKSGKDWYNSSGFGFTLLVPVFDGLQRKNRISQTRLDIKKAEENLRLTAQALKVNLSNYEIQYWNAIDNIRNEKDNMDLAESVYESTRMAFRQGTGSSLELVQAESSFREAQSNYYSKLLDLYIARIELEKSKGNLIEYINNIK